MQTRALHLTADINLHRNRSSISHMGRLAIVRESATQLLFVFVSISWSDATAESNASFSPEWFDVIILNIGNEGTAQVKAVNPDAVSIFILSPRLEWHFMTGFAPCEGE